MVISSFGPFQERWPSDCSLCMSQLSCLNVITEQAQRRISTISQTSPVTTLLSIWGVKECRDATAATQWLANKQEVVIVR